MAFKTYFGEEVIAAHSLSPATDAAGRTGAYQSVKDARAASVVFYIDQANAATVACSVMMATSAAGAGATAYTFTSPVFTTLDEASGIPTRQTDAASYTTDAALKKKVVVLNVDVDALAQSGYTYIAAKTGASNVANLTSATILIETRNAPIKENPAV